MLRVSAVVFDSYDNSLVMQFDNGGIRMYCDVSEVEFLNLSRTDNERFTNEFIRTRNNYEELLMPYVIS